MKLSNAVGIFTKLATTRPTTTSLNPVEVMFNERKLAHTGATLSGNFAENVIS